VFAVVLDVVAVFSILVSSGRLGFINLKLGTLCLLFNNKGAQPCSSEILKQYYASLKVLLLAILFGF
jgi:hypothetical protein